MEREQYPKNCLNKFFVISIIVAGLVFVFLYVVYKHSEKDMMIPDLNRTPITSIMSVNIKWIDSTYCVMLEDGELLSILEEENKSVIPQMKLLHKDFIKLSYKDTLTVDSLSFIQLKDYMIIPQHRIDSIYKNEGVKGLLTAYFDEEWFIPYCKEGLLTLPEQRYVLDILQRHGYSMVIGGESGCLYIIEP